MCLTFAYVFLSKLVEGLGQRMARIMELVLRNEEADAIR
jgi:hypothetical protein